MYTQYSGSRSAARPKRKTSPKLIAAIIIVALALVNALVISIMFTFTDAGLISVGATSLDLRGKGIADFEGFERCEALERLDVRDCPDITPDEVDAFRAGHPGCTLIWSVPVDEQYYDSDTTELDLSGGRVSDLSTLRYLTNLRTLNLSDNMLEGNDVAALRAALPECEITWSIMLGGVFYDSATTSLVLSDIPGEELDRLAWFDALEQVDATACTDYFKLAEIDRAGHSYALDWVVRIGGKAYSPDTGSIVFTEDCGAEIVNLQCLDKLTSVDANCCTAYAELYAAAVAKPDCTISYKVRLTDKITIASNATYADLSNAQIDDFESFKSLLGYLPALTKVKMYDCSLTDEQCDELRTLYPDKGIYWMLHFWRWDVPTNTQVFSCLNKAVTYRRCTVEDLSPLKYCKDLRCVDLGHNGLTDISFLAGLTKLQVIILTDNPDLNDVSALANLKELEYLEIMTTGVTDISALSQTDSLVAINACNCPIKDLTPLYGHTKLQYVILGLNDCEYSEILKVYDALPEIDPADPQKNWDYTDQHKAYVYAFTNWKDVRRYDGWQDYEMK